MMTKAALDLLEALHELGGDSDEVAESLRKQGIKGLRGEHCHCPVANYLKSRGFGGEVWGYPGPSVFRYVSTDVAVVGTPEPVFNFIRRFDDEEFPDLVAEE